MIQITLTTALLIYGMVIMAGFVALYLVGELRAKSVYRVLEKQFMWRCSFCSYLYLDEDAVALSQCPRCGSFNETREAQDRVVSASREHWAPKEEPTESGEEDLPRRNPSRRKRPGQSRRGPRRHR